MKRAGTKPLIKEKISRASFTSGVRHNFSRLTPPGQEALGDTWGFGEPSSRSRSHPSPHTFPPIPAAGTSLWAPSRGSRSSPGAPLAQPQPAPGLRRPGCAPAPRRLGRGRRRPWPSSYGTAPGCPGTRPWPPRWRTFARSTFWSLCTSSRLRRLEAAAETLRRREALGARPRYLWACWRHTHTTAGPAGPQPRPPSAPAPLTPPELPPHGIV